MCSEAWVDSPRLEVHIAWLLEQLEPRRAELEQLLRDPALGADIFCFSLGRCTDPPALPRQLLA